MNQKINSEELKRLRNEIPIKDVIYALNVPWEMDDQIFRFKCPCCEGVKTSLHPKENLARCFSCKKNFNTIDFASICSNKKFRTTITWLQTLSNLMGTDDYQILIHQQIRKSKMK